MYAWTITNCAWPVWPWAFTIVWNSRLQSSASITRDVGATLGLGRGFTFKQKIVGAKVKMFGDAVLEQDSWIPQVSLGVMRKDNDRGDLLRSLGIPQRQRHGCLRVRDQTVPRPRRLGQRHAARDQGQPDRPVGLRYGYEKQR